MWTMVSAVLGTRAGIYRLEAGSPTPLGLADHDVSAVHAFSDPAGSLILLAGTYGNGLFRSDDGGEHWQPSNEGLTAPAFRTIGPDPLNGGAILCGTEPGRIFRSHDGGKSWQELNGIRSIAGYEDWYLPYSPRAGAVRNIYAPPGGRCLLASVEVGGLLDSPDGGESWSCRKVLTDSDIHYITGHPDDPNLLFVALGRAPLKNEKRAEDAPPLGGVARSRDGGRTWTKFFSDYTRGIIIPPARTDLLLAGPAKDIGERGRIEVSADLGDTWEPAGDGLEDPMPDMVEHFHAAPDGSIWAVTSHGRLFRAEPGEWQWSSPLPDQTKTAVRSLAFVPEA
jgi:hypothetical protein